MCPPFEIGIASRALAGENVSGDLPVALAFDGGVLLGAVDGLGHGESAASAARTAVESLGRRARSPLPELLERCHDDLRNTRGVALTLASFDREGAMVWAGVGNVGAVLIRTETSGQITHSSPVLHGGVLGVNLPAVIGTRARLVAGDTLIFATDGIAATSFEGSVETREPPQAIADHFLTRHANGADDALVLVARYLPQLR